MDILKEGNKMISVIYFVLFLILLFICFIVLLKSLDILYLKSFFKTITCLLIVFFSIVFPFVGTYCIAKLLSHQEVIAFFEATYLGQKIYTFFEYYFLPLYIIFAIISIVVMVFIVLGKKQKQTTKPFFVPDGPNVRDDKIEIEKNGFKIRPLKAEDKKHLLNWLTDEKVLEYHDGRDVKYDEVLIQKQYYNQTNISRYILEKDTEAVGYLQYYPLTHEELSKYDFGIDTIVYGIDAFIGIPKYFKKHYDDKFMIMIRDYLLSHGVDLLVVDPLIENKRDITCFEKCGFEIYRILPHHRFHEGTHHDCYLMLCTKEKMNTPIITNKKNIKKKTNAKKTSSTKKEVSKRDK